MARVTLEGISKSFGTLSVLEGIDLDIADGEFLTLVGPSGCGKSTLLRIIAGLETQSAGDVKIDGTVVNEIRPSRRDLAMVFQSYALYPHLSVAKNLATPLELRDLGFWGAFAAGRGLDARPQGESRGPVRGRPGDRRDPQDRASARPQAGPALRRPAATGGTGPGHGARPRGLPDGRAAVKSRRRPQGPHAGGTGSSSSEPGDDLRLRHPRSGGSPHHVHPNGSHDGGQHTADRRARCGFIRTPRTVESPNSSAARRSTPCRARSTAKAG